jgi:DNA-binding transcriptional ArsR family regulator
MTLSEAATVTKALGHPGRLRILAILRDGPLSVCQIATILSAPASTISGHLSDLRRAGFGVRAAHRQVDPLPAQ